MTKSHWLDGIVGIFRKAESNHTQALRTYNIVDSKALGDAAERVRAISVAIVRDSLEKDSKAAVVAYWKDSNTTVYEKTFETKEEATKAFKDITDALEDIKKKTEGTPSGEKVSDDAKQASSEFITYLEKENKKKVWDKDLAKDEEAVTASFGTYRMSKSGAELEFSNEYLASLISPIDIVNVLPASFMNNLPSKVYNTHTFNHVSKQNYSLWQYDNFIVGEKRIPNLVVVEKCGSSKPVYFITATCDCEKFDALCRKLTPELADIKSLACESPVLPLAPKTEDKPEVNKELKGDGVIDNPETKVGSVKVEAKKAEPKFKEYTPQDNAEAGYRITDWGGQHPADLVAFETPLIAKFDKQYGLYEIQFYNGVRTRLQGDVFKTYLYNAGFRVEHVEEILHDVMKDEVVLYGKNHELASKFAKSMVTLVKTATSIPKAMGIIANMTDMDVEAKCDITKVLTAMLSDRTVSDAAIKLSMTDFIEKSASLGITEISDDMVFEAVLKTDPTFTKARLTTFADFLHKVKDPTKSEDSHAEELFQDGLESQEIIDIRKQKLEDAKKSKSLKTVEASFDNTSLEIISMLKSNPSKVDTFSELVCQLEHEGQIDEELAGKYRKLVAELKSLKEI